MSNIGIIDIGSNSFNLIICSLFTKTNIYFEEIFVGIRKGTENNIINKQMQQGQFMEADITFKQITIVKDIFKKKLTNIHHSRVEY